MMEVDDESTPRYRRCKRELLGPVAVAVLADKVRVAVAGALVLAQEGPDSEKAYRGGSGALRALEGQLQKAEVLALELSRTAACVAGTCDLPVAGELTPTGGPSRAGGPDCTERQPRTVRERPLQCQDQGHEHRIRQDPPTCRDVRVWATSGPVAFPSRVTNDCGTAILGASAPSERWGEFANCPEGVLLRFPATHLGLRTACPAEA
jgi:hypothetical protein